MGGLDVRRELTGGHHSRTGDVVKLRDLRVLLGFPPHQLESFLPSALGHIEKGVQLPDRVPRRGGRHDGQRVVPSSRTVDLGSFDDHALLPEGGFNLVLETDDLAGEVLVVLDDLLEERSVVVVLCDRLFEEADYLREYSDFVSFRKANQ